MTITVTTINNTSKHSFYEAYSGKYFNSPVKLKQIEETFFLDHESNYCAKTTLTFDINKFCLPFDAFWSNLTALQTVHSLPLIIRI